MKRGRAGLALSLVAALATAAGGARADDGVYGRFDGDLTLALGAGAAVDEGGASFATLGRALFLGVAGPHAGYARAFDDGPVTQRLTAGVTVAPLFPARFAYDREHGPAWVDLLIDSASLDLGVAWVASRGAGLDSAPGLELGAGLAIPLGTRATGLFVDTRGSLTFSDAALRNAPGADAYAALTLTLAFHAVVASHLVDAGDRRPE